MWLPAGRVLVLEWYMAELPTPPRKPKSMKEFDYFKEAEFFDGANQSDVDALQKTRLKRTLWIHGVMTILVTVTVLVDVSPSRSVATAS